MVGANSAEPPRAAAATVSGQPHEGTSASSSSLEGINLGKQTEAAGLVTELWKALVRTHAQPRARFSS